MRSAREPVSNWKSTIAASLLMFALLSAPHYSIAQADEKPIAESKFGERISLHSRPLLWHPERRLETTAGKLQWAGGIELKSDSEDFGGLSGLAVSHDGVRLLAVSDEGAWFTARILYDEKGRLAGLAEGMIAPMRGLDGKPIGPNKWLADAEALTVDNPDPLKGKAYVAFERSHRIWVYDLGEEGFAAKPTQLLTQRDFGRLNTNAGIEALALLPPSAEHAVRLLAVTENTRDPRNHYRAFIFEDRNVNRLAVRAHEPFRPTDIARLPNGDFLLLERRFSMLAGVGMQIRLLKADDVKAGAVVDGEVLMQADPRYSIDNMEGIAVRDDGHGGQLVYIISDDNKSPLQRTLLLMFRLKI